MSRFAIALFAIVALAAFAPLNWILPAMEISTAAAEEDPQEHAGEVPHGADDGHGSGEHADDSHGAHANTNPLSSNPDLALFTLIIFALLLLILGKFAWGPIREALERREQSIADQIAEAERSRDEARRLLDEHETKLAHAQDEIRGLMDEARKEADLQKNSILEQAETAAAEQQARGVHAQDPIPRGQIPLPDHS